MFRRHSTLHLFAIATNSVLFFSTVNMHAYRKKSACNLVFIQLTRHSWQNKIYTLSQSHTHTKFDFHTIWHTLMCVNGVSVVFLSVRNIQLNPHIRVYDNKRLHRKVNLLYLMRRVLWYVFITHWWVCVMQFFYSCCCWLSMWTVTWWFYAGSTM